MLELSPPAVFRVVIFAFYNFGICLQNRRLEKKKKKKEEGEGVYVMGVSTKDDRL